MMFAFCLCCAPGLQARILRPRRLPATVRSLHLLRQPGARARPSAPAIARHAVALDGEISQSL